MPELRLAAGDPLSLAGAARAALADLGPQVDALALGRCLEAVLAARPAHGEEAAFAAALAALPPLRPSGRALDAPAVRIGSPGDATPAEAAALREALLALHPWRKGPFELFGVGVDAEWRSDLKWARVAAAASPLAGRRVLDVGCGNGYYLLRMLGAGAACALGVDPALRCLAQFLALRRYLPGLPAAVLPLAGEDLPAPAHGFDTVFSMGVIYHRRDPAAHLAELARQLRPGGELVLETLVVEGAAGSVLVPPGRYAKMPNVRAIPSPDVLLDWLARAGFRSARIAHLGPTTVQEQRRTDWMRFESLADFLDPADPSRTVEGHPAPLRALAIASSGC